MAGLVKVAVKQNNAFSQSRDRLASRSIASRPAGTTTSHAITVGSYQPSRSASQHHDDQGGVDHDHADHHRDASFGGAMLRRVAEMFLIGDAMTIPLRTMMVHHGTRMFLLIDGMVLTTVEMILSPVLFT